MKKTLKKAGALLVATGLVVSSAMPVAALLLSDSDT